MLEEIEKSLYQEDPAFARQVRRRAPRLDSSQRARIGVITFLCGFALLFGFFFRGWVALGVMAFVAMVAGIVLVAGSFKGFSTSTRGQKERWSNSFKEWEDRARRRYRGP